MENPDKAYHDLLLRHAKRHSRYSEWVSAVLAGKTVSGLDAWVETQEDRENMETFLSKRENFSSVDTKGKRAIL